MTCDEAIPNRLAARMVEYGRAWYDHLEDVGRLTLSLSFAALLVEPDPVFLAVIVVVMFATWLRRATIFPKIVRNLRRATRTDSRLQAPLKELENHMFGTHVNMLRSCPSFWISGVLLAWLGLRVTM